MGKISQGEGNNDSLIFYRSFAKSIRRLPEEEQLKALHHCLEKLPEEQRTSITRFFLEEMSYADIVEQTGFTLNNVKSYIQNGKRNLKICIKKQAL